MRDMPIPSVPWRRHRVGDVLDPDVLWTVRSAVVDPTRPDQSLPKLVGATGDEATGFADCLAGELGDGGMVVTYPYFSAVSSGTVLVRDGETYVEACHGDLWNLVDHGRVDFRGRLGDGGWSDSSGDPGTVPDEVPTAIGRSLGAIRRQWRDDLFEGRGVLLEWCLSRSVGSDGNPVGEPDFVFMEARTVE